MSKKHKSRKLNVQISLYFFVSIAIIIILLGLVLFYSISNIIMADVYQKTSDAITNESSYLAKTLEDITDLAKSISEHDSTIKYLVNNDLESEREFKNINEFVLESNSSITSIVIVKENGEVIPKNCDLDITTSSSMKNEKWYKAAIKSNNKPVLTSLRRQDFELDKNNWVISISQEIIDKTGGHLGVLLIDIQYDFIEDYLSTIDLGSQGYAFILTKSGEIVYHDDISYFADKEKVKKLVAICELGDGYKSNMDLVTFKTNIVNTDWILVGLSSLDSLDVIKRQVIETIVFIGIVLLFLSIGVNVFIANRLSNPIKELENVMSSVESELVKVDVMPNGCFETESLSNHYNLLVDKIVALMNDIKSNERNLRDFELKALQSQINPHFLYNTLDTIIWMAEFGDHKKVISITKSLATFFRLSLNKGRELVSLKDELEHIKQYLLIQKERYEDKLSYSFEIEDCLLDVLIPKITLQPIIENAIYHGIRELDSDGMIRILVHKSNEKVIISITDNGVGFNSKDVTSSNNKLGGVGLRNVDDRLKLYYGDNYGLEIESSSLTGTSVKVIIPYKN